MSDMELNPKRENVTLLNKYPLAFAGGAFLILAGIFIGLYAYSQRERTSDCKETIQAAYKERDEAKAKSTDDNNKLVQVLLILSEKQQQQKYANDSLFNKTIGNKARQILNSQNH